MAEEAEDAFDKLKAGAKSAAKKVKVKTWVMNTIKKKARNELEIMNNRMIQERKIRCHLNQQQ